MNDKPHDVGLHPDAPNELSRFEARRLAEELLVRVDGFGSVSQELGGIRATLLLNFGSTSHDNFGVRLKNPTGKTFSILIDVLEQLIDKQKAGAGA